MIKNEYIAFLYGLLVKIVDDINDFHIFTAYKPVFELILILLSVYVVFINKQLAPIASCTFAIGGLIAFLFIPHAVDADIWKFIIILSIPCCLYYIAKFTDLWTHLTTTDIHNLSYFILPLTVIAIVFSIIEDILVPEEQGNRKLIDKILQSIAMILFLYIIHPLASKINLNELHKQLLIIVAHGWLGYAITSVIILIFYINNFNL